jgi:membrane-associated phospholipid phosphatase
LYVEILRGVLHGLSATPHRIPGLALRAPSSGVHPTARVAVLAAVTAIVGAAGFVWLALVAGSTLAAPAFDTTVLTALAAARAPALTLLFRTVTLVGEWWAATAISIAAVALLLLRKKRAYAAMFAVVMSAGWLVETLVKDLFHRPRPPALEALVHLPASFSFPSGHAFVSLVVCALLLYLEFRLVPRRGARIALFMGATVLVLLVGVSRVYLGVHWPSDVLASWCLAMAWLGLALGGFTLLSRRSGTRGPGGTLP